jgi:hypothetical protein
MTTVGFLIYSGVMPLLKTCVVLRQFYPVFLRRPICMAFG